MKKWYRSLNLNFKVMVWTILLTIVIFLGLSVLFFFSYGEYPLGFLLGATLAVFNYLVMGLIEKSEKKTKSAAVQMVIVFVRLILIAIILFGVGLLYYRANIHIFNIFTVAGGYIMGLIIALIIALVEGKHALSVN